MVLRKGFMVGALAATVLAMGSVVAQASSLGFHDAEFSYDGAHFGTYTGGSLVQQAISYGPGAGSAGFMSFASTATGGLGFVGAGPLTGIDAKIFNSSHVLVFEATAASATLLNTGGNAFAFNFVGLAYPVGLPGTPTNASVSLNIDSGSQTVNSFSSLPLSTQGAFNAVPELSSTLGLVGMVLGGGLLGFRRRRSK